MGRIYRPAPSKSARLNDYRWQDDPQTGWRWTDYLVVLLPLAVGGALVYALGHGIQELIALAVKAIWGG